MCTRIETFFTLAAHFQHLDNTVSDKSWDRVRLWETKLNCVIGETVRTINSIRDASITVLLGEYIQNVQLVQSWKIFDQLQNVLNLNVNFWILCVCYLQKETSVMLTLSALPFLPPIFQSSGKNSTLIPLHTSSICVCGRSRNLSTRSPSINPSGILVLCSVAYER